MTLKRGYCDELCSLLSYDCGIPHVTWQTAKVVTWPWKLTCSTTWPFDSKLTTWPVTRNMECMTGYQSRPRPAFKRDCPIGALSHHLLWNCIICLKAAHGPWGINTIRVWFYHLLRNDVIGPWGSTQTIGMDQMLTDNLLIKLHIYKQTLCI